MSAPRLSTRSPDVTKVEISLGGASLAASAASTRAPTAPVPDDGDHLDAVVERLLSPVR